MKNIGKNHLLLQHKKIGLLINLDALPDFKLASTAYYKLTNHLFLCKYIYIPNSCTIKPIKFKDGQSFIIKIY